MLQERNDTTYVMLQETNDTTYVMLQEKNDTTYVMLQETNDTTYVMLQETNDTTYVMLQETKDTTYVMLQETNDTTYALFLGCLTKLSQFEWASVTLISRKAVEVTVHNSFTFRAEELLLILRKIAKMSAYVTKNSNL